MPATATATWTPNNTPSDMKAFNADAARFDRLLAPWVRTMTVTADEFCPDGVFTYIAADAPADLVASYQRFMQYGYANGLV